MAEPTGHTGAQPESNARVLSVFIVTPQGTSAEYNNVRHLRAPGIDGDFGVLPGHVPFMTALRIGALVIDSEQGKKLWATSGGFVEVLSDRVTILAETAESADQIDIDRAEASRKRALGRLTALEAENVDSARANGALARAINRIRVVSERGQGE